MKIRTLTLAAIMCSMTFGTIQAQNTKPIELKKGQKYLIENSTNTYSATEVQGQQMEVIINASTTTEVEVADKKEDTYQLSNTVTKLKTEISQMGQQIKYDSENPADQKGPMAESFKEFLGKPQAVKIKSNGDILPDKNKSSSNNPALANLESSGYGVEGAFRGLPKELKTGTTWTTSSKANGTEKKVTYTVKSISGDIATLDVQGTVSVNTTIEQMGMEMNTSAKGKFTGEEKVHTATGVLQSQNLTINTDGYVEVMGQQLPTSSKTTSNTIVKTL